MSRAPTVVRYDGLGSNLDKSLLAKVADEKLDLFRPCEQVSLQGMDETLKRLEVACRSSICVEKPQLSWHLFDYGQPCAWSQHSAFGTQWWNNFRVWKANVDARLTAIGEVSYTEF